jgi:hypothetical protein
MFLVEGFDSRRRQVDYRLYALTRISAQLPAPCKGSPVQRVEDEELVNVTEPPVQRPRRIELLKVKPALQSKKRRGRR